MVVGMKDKKTDICIEISELNLSQALFFHGIIFPMIADLIEVFEDQIIELGKEE